MLDASIMIGIGRPEEKSPVVLRKVYLRAGVDVSMQDARFILIQYWDGSVCPPRPYTHITIQGDSDVAFLVNAFQEGGEIVALVPDRIRVFTVWRPAEDVFQRLFGAIQKSGFPQ